MTLMSDNGDIREDLRVPDNEVGKEIMTKFQANEEFYVSPASSFSFYTFRNFRNASEVLLTIKPNRKLFFSFCFCFLIS